MLTAAARIDSVLGTVLPLKTPVNTDALAAGSVQTVETETIWTEHGYRNAARPLPHRHHSGNMARPVIKTKDAARAATVFPENTADVQTPHQLHRSLDDQGSGHDRRI